MNESVQLIKRGEIYISGSEILKTVISTCVSVCLYHPRHRVGGMTHISSSRVNDSTPSRRYIKSGGYYYADNAIEGLLQLFHEKLGILACRGFEAAIIGGMDNEGPVSEALDELRRYDFRVVGSDTNQNLHRQILFNTISGSIIIYRNRPFQTGRDQVEIDFSRTSNIPADDGTEG